VRITLLVHGSNLLHLGAQLLEAFLEQELHVGVHGTEDSLLLTGEVDWVQIVAGMKSLIPIVSAENHQQAEIGGEERRTKLGEESQRNVLQGRRRLTILLHHN
jgi:hypothetical protein